MGSKSASMAEPALRQSGISKNIFVLTVVLVALVSFVAGTRQHELLAAVGPVFGVKVAAGTLDTSTLQATYRQLKANYDGPLDPSDLIDGANQGLVAAAGDQYTVYMTAEEARQFDKDLSGNIGGGIGAEIGVRHEQPTIIRTLRDTPAEKAGLKPGDVIAKVNNTDTNGWTADKAAGIIRGEIGTTVKLQVVRDGELQEFTITRANITSPSVESEVRDGIGILTLSRFDENTAREAKRAAEDFKRQNVKGVVLDLRGNGGGYLSAAQDVAGLWLDRQLVVTERRGGKVQEELRSGGNPVLAGVPTTVLVNGSSASASEIVAGALQDHGVATLIGEKTYGKGTVQRLIDLRGGAELKVTIARWYTPKGKNITSEGITPDTVIELTKEDVDADRDPQMSEAMSTLGAIKG